MRQVAHFRNPPVKRHVALDMESLTTTQQIATDIPARLDRLAFGRMHGLVVAALGVTWILDGLEVTIVGSLSGVLSKSSTLHLSATQIGMAGSTYIAGAVLGALLFGDLADRFGRKRLFTVTVGVYLLATVATGLSWDFWSFAFFRALTGAGIGGEYSAINSAIQEFVPARYRGRTDLAVNGSFWIGAALGAGTSLVVLDPHLVPEAWGWRLAFIIGGALAGIAIVLRRFVPESPRWLLLRGRVQEAEAIARDFERHANAPPAGDALRTLVLAPTRRTLAELVAVLLKLYPQRALLSLVLMTTQAFCYNAIFFTYALILTKFYGVPGRSVGLYILPFAAGNFLGPLLLGPLFDRLGRKPMIAATYGIAGLLLLVTGWAFVSASVGATGETALWTVTFFFASCGASAAYLTVGESFPLEVRARAIGLFYAFGSALGGITGPLIFGALIEGGTRNGVLWGYVTAGLLMIAAALTELRLGVPAERRALEDVAPPLSATP
jgi:MFS family permease